MFRGISHEFYLSAFPHIRARLGGADRILRLVSTHTGWCLVRRADALLLMQASQIARIGRRFAEQPAAESDDLRTCRRRFRTDDVIGEGRGKAERERPH